MNYLSPKNPPIFQKKGPLQCYHKTEVPYMVKIKYFMVIYRICITIRHRDKFLLPKYDDLCKNIMIVEKSNMCSTSENACEGILHKL